MCGISGVLSFSDSVNINKFRSMNDIIQHRGPDDEGFCLWNKNNIKFAYGNDTMEKLKNKLNDSIVSYENQMFNLCLGHRRLSIIDISEHGHQPMAYSDIVIVFNGEIYNYIELRNELIQEGFIFNTEGDTEVIINSYLHWCEDCVCHFNGMWSFALWDSKKEKLFCSRDRLGEKPFYYSMINNQFVFGSEIKQILEYGINAKINDEILHVYLISGLHDFSEETFFQSIYSLPGGYNLSIQNNINENKLNIEKYSYWKLLPVENDSKLNTFEDFKAMIGKELEKSINLRLRSDVKVGSCLSGGLDSSSVVTLACERLGNSRTSFNTFTACYDSHKKVDETYYSDQIVNNSKCKNYKVKPNHVKLKNDFDKLVWHQDEPFGSMGIFASWCVMEAANAENVRVLLDGQGGDETLLGYERLYSYLLKEKLKKLKLIDFSREFILSSKNSRLSLKHLIGYALYFNNKSIRKIRLSNRANKFMNNEFKTQFKLLDKVDNLLTFKNLHDAQKSELEVFIGHLLRYEDRNSMAYSIEARVPFLDPNFVEKSLGIPNRYKLNNGWTKAVLRAYMSDKMPEEVAYRKSKLGFSVPQEEWLNELNDYYKSKLVENARSSRFFNMEFIKEIFEKKTHSDVRFKFIMIETWMRVFHLY